MEVFYWSVSDSKSTQVSRTFLGIPSDLNNTVVWPRIQRLHLNECPGYDTKQSDGEAQVMQTFWGMQSTPLLTLLPGHLWPGVVVPNMVLSMGEREVNCVLLLN